MINVLKINCGLLPLRPNEEQIITGYSIDGAMERSGGGRVRKFFDVCLHNNAIVARGILVTNTALWSTRTASAPCILLVLLEPHCPVKTKSRMNLTPRHVTM